MFNFKISVEEKKLDIGKDCQQVSECIIAGGMCSTKKKCEKIDGVNCSGKECQCCKKGKTQLVYRFSYIKFYSQHDYFVSILLKKTFY